ncbi:MAG: bifunctional precorrin-2 dehydrogenase/sirohydrochlorin ferrochelatase [Chloroflexota bacterium]
MTEVYPIFVRADRLRCVVIGGGPVAARKLRGLRDAGARVTVIAPDIHPDIAAMVESEHVHVLRRVACDEDVEHAELVFLATSDRAVNMQLEIVARAGGALVNRADSPEDGTFHVPAVLRRGDITVALATGGRGPAFSRMMRDELEGTLTAERVELLHVIAEARETAHAAGITISGDAWKNAVDDEVRFLARTGNRAGAVRRILDQVSALASAVPAQ